MHNTDEGTRLGDKAATQRLLEPTMLKLTLAALLALSVSATAFAAAPGSSMAENTRSCFTLKPAPGQTVTKLLLELHKEVVNPGEEPVLWAGVYGEKKGEAHPGFNRDGCGSDGDHLSCSFSCDGGMLRIKEAEGDVAIMPDGLVLKSCGLGTDVPGGFQLNQKDVGETALMTPVDDRDCRTLMEPMEKAIDDAENGIE